MDQTGTGAFDPTAASNSWTRATISAKLTSACFFGGAWNFDTNDFVLHSQGGPPPQGMDQHCFTSCCAAKYFWPGFTYFGPRRGCMASPHAEEMINVPNVSPCIFKAPAAAIVAREFSIGV